jgi:hypothetical protein
LYARTIFWRVLPFHEARTGRIRMWRGIQFCGVPEVCDALRSLFVDPPERVGELSSFEE